MDTFDKWFSRFMWSTDIILLVASMPHIAAWFAHFDNPSTSNFLSELYAWGVGFGLAFAIDGVSFMLLLAMTRMIKSGKTKSWGVMTGLIFFMALIAALSWGINWQYNVVFASSTFAKADAITVYGTLTVGGINPIIGGAFPILMLAYALVAKAMQTEVKSIAAYSDEDFQQKLKRIQQEKELKDAQKGKGIVARIGDGLAEAKQVYSNLTQDENADELEEETDDESEEESEPELPEKKERNTGPLTQESEEGSNEKEEGNVGGNDEETNQETSGNLAIDPDTIQVVARYPKVAEMLSTKGTTVSVDDVANAFDVTPTLVRNRVKNGKIRKTKNPEIVFKNAVISWAKSELLPRRKGKVIRLATARNSQKKTDEKQQVNANG